MQVHFIDDDETFIELLDTQWRRQGGIKLTHSCAIGDVRDRILSHPVDCILVDINRPDAISMQDDVENIRALSSAPIIFITGENAEGLRSDAISAGAEGIIDKDSLSPALIKQMFYNSVARMFGHHSLETPDPEGEVTAPVLPNSNLNRFHAPLDYLQLGLETMIDIAQRGEEGVSVSFIHHLLETVNAIKVYANSDLSTETLTPAHEIVVRLRTYFEDLARIKDIKIEYDLQSGWFSQIGPPELAQIGIYHLLEGIVRACSPGDEVYFQIRKMNAATVVSVDISRLVIPGPGVFFSGQLDDLTFGPDARASLNLAVLMLNLRAEQIEVHPTTLGQRLNIHL
ncbi:MAG: response regulator [Pseudomonadota bacterium]